MKCSKKGCEYERGLSWLLDAPDASNPDAPNATPGSFHAAKSVHATNATAPAPADATVSLPPNYPKLPVLPG